MAKKDKISEALGAQTGLPVPKFETENKELVDARSKEISTIAGDLRKKMAENKSQDYEEARGNIKRMISEGMAVIPGMIDMVRECENPKMYDSAAGFMKAITEMNKTLLTLSDDIEEKSSRKTPNAPSEAQKPAEPQVQQTNVYITTESLLDNVSSKKGKDPAIDAEYTEVDKD